ncbi:hypothetical protein AtDm6_1875 [Acetobacter tropicalis]|uniref:Uncharacterized protein n=1 Tax=Acetobacter tropicalis TaxID=104102 RepID=A0A094ZKR4_9PROT|nr:hypothetical protein AtDm6_1875 [Acetobacter tropicalis]
MLSRRKCGFIECGLYQVMQGGRLFALEALSAVGLLPRALLSVFSRRVPVLSG